MKNVLLLSPAASDAAVLSVSSQLQSLPAANLQSYRPDKKWRAYGTTEWVALDLGTPVACNTLALVAHNLSAGGTLRVRGAASQAAVTAAPVVDTAARSAWPATGKATAPRWPHWLSLLTWANETPLRYWRVDIVDPGNSDGWLEAGRLMLGPKWQPSLNFDLGGTPLALDQMDVQAKTSWGRLFTDRRATSAARIFAVEISALDKREVMGGLFEIQRERGLWGDVVCCLDPEEGTDFHVFSMQGVFVQRAEYPIVPYFTPNGAMFTAKIQLNELI